MNMRKGRGKGGEGKGREEKAVLALNGRRLSFCSPQTAHHQSKNQKTQVKDCVMWCSESITGRAVCGPFRGLALELMPVGKWRMRFGYNCSHLQPYYAWHVLQVVPHFIDEQSSRHQFHQVMSPVCRQSNVTMAASFVRILILSSYLLDL